MIGGAFKANIRGSNQIKLVPRNDKDGPTVATRLQVNRICRRGRKWRDHEVTAFCSSNQLRTLHRRSLKHKVYPRPRSIDHNLSLSKLFLALFRNEFNTGNLSIFNSKTRHPRMGPNLSAKFAR